MQWFALDVIDAAHIAALARKRVLGITHINCVVSVKSLLEEARSKPGT
jgi:hypothetical protein